MRRQWSAMLLAGPSSESTPHLGGGLRARCEAYLVRMWGRRAWGTGLGDEGMAEGLGEGVGLGSGLGLGKGKGLGLGRGGLGLRVKRVAGAQVEDRGRDQVDDHEQREHVDDGQEDAQDADEGLAVTVGALRFKGRGGAEGFGLGLGSGRAEAVVGGQGGVAGRRGEGAG